MSKPQSHFTLDAIGKCCPMPIVETNKAIRRLTAGQVLEIIATDVGTRSDIPSWCERTGNTLLGIEEHDQEIHFYVRKEQ